MGVIRPPDTGRRRCLICGNLVCRAGLGRHDAVFSGMDKHMDEQPQWQPISILPMCADMVDGMLESSQEQLANMQLAREKPHIMDDATLQRVVELYSNQLEDHWL